MRDCTTTSIASKRKCLADLPQTAAAALRVVHCFGHQPPEFRGVTLHREVGQLVDDDVLREHGREHHGAPVEAQRAVRGAAAPALALVTNSTLGVLAW